jgi:hypothetical protein
MLKVIISLVSAVVCKFMPRSLRGSVHDIHGVIYLRQSSKPSLWLCGVLAGEPISAPQPCDLTSLAMPLVNQLNSLETATEFATPRVCVCVFSIMAMHPKVWAVTMRQLE